MPETRNHSTPDMPCVRERACEHAQRQAHSRQDAGPRQHVSVHTNTASSPEPSTVFSAVPAQVVSPQQPDSTDQLAAAELPSEGILRSYAASQQLQLHRQQSLSHHTVQPFLSTMSLEQALLTYVPYIPVSAREQQPCKPGRAATAA